MKKVFLALVLTVAAGYTANNVYAQSTAKAQIVNAKEVDGDKDKKKKKSGSCCATEQKAATTEKSSCSSTATSGKSSCCAAKKSGGK